MTDRRQATKPEKIEKTEKAPKKDLSRAPCVAVCVAHGARLVKYRD